MVKLITSALRVYGRYVSPTVHAVGGPECGCRFSPSCSHYAIESVEQHGAVAGSLLAAKRLMRCGPWSAGGVDPVPRRHA